MNDIDFLPDPVLGEDGDYKSFDAVYGTPTKDSDRPSLQFKPQTTENDQKHKKLFTGGGLYQVTSMLSDNVLACLGLELSPALSDAFNSSYSGANNMLSGYLYVYFD